MQIRIKRLQDMFKSLGRDPNAKEYEVRQLVSDFDKVARKLIAKVKKAKNEQLYSRQQILMRFGLRSSQRMTIDEEINTLIKGMDHDYKRLQGILLGYREKKGEDIASDEIKEREKVSQLLLESNHLFQLAYQEQTRNFERTTGKNGSIGAEDKMSNDLDDNLMKVAKKLEGLEKQSLLEADADMQFDHNFGLLQYVYMPSS